MGTKPSKPPGILLEDKDVLADPDNIPYSKKVSVFLWTEVLKCDGPFCSDNFWGADRSKLEFKDIEFKDTPFSKEIDADFKRQAVLSVLLTFPYRCEQNPFFEALYKILHYFSPLISSTFSERGSVVLDVIKIVSRVDDNLNRYTKFLLTWFISRGIISWNTCEQWNKKKPFEPLTTLLVRYRRFKENKVCDAL